MIEELKFELGSLEWEQEKIAKRIEEIKSKIKEIENESR